MIPHTKSDVGLPGAKYPNKWRLEAKPAFVDVSRKTVMSTPVGKWLDKHGMLTNMILFSAFFGVSVYISLLVLGERVTSSFSSEETHEPTSHSMVKWDVYRCVIFSIDVIWVAFLALHRVNLQLFIYSVRSFDCMMIMAHYIIWVICRFMVEVKVFEDYVDGIWKFEYFAIHIIFGAAILLFAGCVDAFRVRTVRKVLVLSAGAGGILVYWTFVTYAGTSWPNHGLCALGATCNELKRRHLSACFTMMIFLTKAIAQKVLHKNSFVVYRPCFEAVQVLETKPDEERKSEQGVMEERLERSEQKVQALSMELMTVRAQLTLAEQQHHRRHEHVELCEQSCQVSLSDAALSTGDRLQIAAADNSASFFAGAQTLHSLPLTDERAEWAQKVETLTEELMTVRAEAAQKAKTLIEELMTVRAEWAQKVETMTEELMTVRAELQAATQHLQARQKRLEFRDQSCQVSSSLAPLSTGQEARLKEAVASSSALEGVQAPDALRLSAERPSCDCAAEIRRRVLSSPQLTQRPTLTN